MQRGKSPGRVTAGASGVSRLKNADVPEQARQLSQYLTTDGRLGKLTPNYALIKVSQFYNSTPTGAPPAMMPAVLFFETLSIIVGEARATKEKKKLKGTMFE